MSVVRLATRASDLALAQARLVAGLLEEQLGARTELLPLKTTGDRLQGVPLAEVGGKGLFVKEIEEALLDGRADLAVHSAKDLPAELPDGLSLVAFPERADPRDALLSRVRGWSLDALPSGARVGTGSARRAAQLLALRPELDVVPLRGNVPTRIRKLESENLDAVILACAGLERLGLAERIDERLSPELMLPAATQGILAIEGRVGDAIADDAQLLSDPFTAAQAAAERGVLQCLGADCNVPLAVFAEPASEGLRLRALLIAPEGDVTVRAEEAGRVDGAAALGQRVGERLLATGGEALLARLQGGSRS